MAQKFSRHEQFLRVFSLLEILSASHAPLSDEVLIATLRDRLGLSRLSARTLRRDCEFPTSCGYPIDHVPIPRERKYGWKLNLDGPLSKKLLSEPLTLLELIAFQLARMHLKPYEGTPLWTGIEMLRSRFERCVPSPSGPSSRSTSWAFGWRSTDRGGTPPDPGSFHHSSPRSWPAAS
jgi:predicted DNA-binding transcriptional regulator YafY